jgi:site-specific DNA-methyltransferase (adenine-specific)
MDMADISIIFQNNIDYLRKLPDAYVDLIYIDPPFNTGKVQKRKSIKGKFGGERKVVGEYASFEDSFDNFEEFMRPRLIQALRVLKPTGSIYVHLDYHEVHYIKVLMDTIFGRSNFMGELIWSYEWGAKSKTKWSMKHDNILYYVKDKKHYTFNYDKVPRVPYLAPELVGPEKAARGKTLCSVWWHTIVGTNSKEKQNYATQKPVGILNRIVDVSSNPGDLCLDFFAGSGSFGQACKALGRNCILVDNNPKAIEIMKRRFR